MWPALHVWQGDKSWETLPPPTEIEPRAWLLGVAGIQLYVEAGKLQAQLRLNSTGRPTATLLPLNNDSVVHAALGEFRLPELESTPSLEAGECARLSLFLDGKLSASTLVRPEQLMQTPSPRAFAHVFCRWLRAPGQFEAGCDLTDFLSLPDGQMFERKFLHHLQAGEKTVVSYRLALNQ